MRKRFFRTHSVDCSECTAVGDGFRSQRCRGILRIQGALQTSDCENRRPSSTRQRTWADDEAEGSTLKYRGGKPMQWAPIEGAPMLKNYVRSGVHACRSILVPKN